MNYIIGSFNIQKFNFKSNDETKKNFQRIANIIKGEKFDVFKRCSNALKENGILYCSFKKGDYEGIIDSRFFNYINEELLKEYIKDTNLEIIEDIITRDSLSNRDIKWLNVILRKVM